MSQKEPPRQITVPEMAPHVHSFGVGENKVLKISKWLIKWISSALEEGRIKPYDMLPSKSDLAFHIGVSRGTMQSVFRYVEDCGYIESKQRIGTYIKDMINGYKLKKLTSKRELAAEAIKKHIVEYGYKEGDSLISTRKLAKLTGVSNATIRTALGSLISIGIIGKKYNSFIVLTSSFESDGIVTKTLAQKVAESIQDYIKKSLKPGEKLPPNSELASMFAVSVKTIHDASKLLVKEGILYSRRGRYGTIVSDKSDSLHARMYNYEKIEQKISHYISEKCAIGDKLPSIKYLAEKFDVSPKTIKKALDNLAEEGYLAFSRGRYGGTFVTDIPQEGADAYKWLALNSDYISNIEN